MAPKVAEAVRAVPVPVWVIDRGGVTFFVNPEAAEMAGRPVEALVGTPAPAELAAVAAEANGQWRECVLEGPEGTRFVRVRASELDGGGPAVLTLIDVTERTQRLADLRLALRAERSLMRVSHDLLTLDVRGALASAMRVTTAELGVPFALINAISSDGAAAMPLARVARRAIEDRPPNREGGYYVMPRRSASLVALERTEPFRVDDYGSQPFECSPVLLDAGVQSSACIPVAGGKGVLLAFGDRLGAFDGRAMRFLEGVGRLTSARWDLPPDPSKSKGRPTAAP
jgi:hypothetical protein